MSRVGLAFRCFFRVLFGGTLPASAVDFLPEEARPALLPDTAESTEKKQSPASEAIPAEPAPEAPREERTEPEPAAEAKAAQTKSQTQSKSSAVAKDRARAENQAQHQLDGALALLSLMQREGRLVDFLQESLDDYDDDDIGASVRDIHRGLRKVLGDHLELEAVMPGEEDEPVTIPKGFDPGEVKLIGEVSGEPPFKGVLRHHGWRVTKTMLPELSDGVDRTVLAPAEVEVS